MTAQIDLGPAFTYGDRLRRVRRNAGLDQRAMAARLRMTRSTYSSHENWDDEGLPASAGLVAQAVELKFGVPAEWVLGQDMSENGTLTPKYSSMPPDPRPDTRRYAGTIAALMPPPRGSRRYLSAHPAA